MHDIRSTLDGLNRLRRPKLLVKAARIGEQGYRREAHLAQVIGPGPLPSPREALARLLEIEARHDGARQTRAAEYRAARHVEVLIAVMGEARILADAAPAPAAQLKASGISALRLAT